jgi:hypothetical protein
MPQKGSADLFHLIKSLDRTEKAYFKKFAERHVIGEQNNYVRLFDALDKQLIYEEAKILKEEKYIRQLPYLKNYLFDLVMKSMDAYHAESSPENRIENEISHIRFLYQKGLFDVCHKLIAKTKKACVNFEFYPDAIKLVSLEIYIMNKTARHRNNKKKYDGLYRKRSLYLEQYKTMTAYSELEKELEFKRNELLGERKTYHKDDFVAVMNHELMQDEKRATSISAKLLFYNIHSLYNFYTNDLEKYSYYAGLYKDLRKQQYLRSGNVLRYIPSLNNYILSCIAAKRYDYCQEALEELKTLPVKTLKEEEEIMGIFLMFKVGLYMLTGEFKKGKTFLGQYLPLYERIEPIMQPRRKIIFQLNITSLYFSNGDYKESLKWINVILVPEYVKINQEVHCHALIVNMMIHYELGNLDLLAYLLKSAQRFYKTNNLLKPLEKVMLSLFSKLTRSNINEKEIFRQTKKEVEAIFRDPFYQYVNSYFDYMIWFERKTKK